MIENIWNQIVSSLQWVWSYDLGKVLLVGLSFLYAYGLIVDIKSSVLKYKIKYNKD